MSEAEIDQEVRGVLLPLCGAQLLLPNASVSEVVPVQEMDSESDTPEWFLGYQKWRFQNIPVVSFEKLVDVPFEGPNLKSRVAICNTIGGDPKRPFIGVLLSSMPRLVRVTADVVAPQISERGLGPVVMREVVINGEEAWIPDITSVESLIQEALA